MLHRGEAVGTGRNISLAQIQSQIDVLNEDFRRLNADRINTPAAFTGVASDYNFEFRLACQDPNGNAAIGVLRRLTNKTNFQFIAIPNTNGVPDENAIGIKMTSISGEDPWPTDRYLNIWVGDFNDGTLGYATFPADFAVNPNVDGVVISTTAMGRVGNVLAPFERGRTATHEVGHWLNLRHVSGDAFCGNDFVDDTPTQQTQNFGCPAFPHRTCGNVTNGDMFMNYMDFTDDGCMNIFSNGQRLRGRAIFAVGGPRAAFIDNYFRIQQPAATISCTGTVSLTNPNCIPPTWSVVSGPATISSVGTNQVTLQATGTATVILRATGGNYFSEITTNISYSPPSANIGTLIYPNGQRGVDPVTLLPDFIYQFYSDFVPGASSFTWVLPSGFSFVNGESTSSPGIRTSAIEGTYPLYCSANNACGSSWTHSLGIIISNTCTICPRIAQDDKPPADTNTTFAKIALYPNPANTELKVRLRAPAEQEGELSLMDFSGNVKRNEIIQKGTQWITLGTSDIFPGMYVIKINDGSKEYYRKVLVQH